MAYFRKRGNTWSFTVDIGRDLLTQKRIQKTQTGFASEPLARIACDKFLLEHEQGMRSDTITLEAFIKLFLESEVKHQITESSYTNQWQWARDYIIPVLGKHRIDKLKHTHVVAFYNRLLKEGESRGLIRNVAMVLSKTLKAAIVAEYVTKNAAAHASPPSYTPKKITVWTEDEMKDFIERSESSWLHELYVLALTTGMREGEMLALNWTDIDFTRNIITIDKSLKYTGDSGLFIKDPKTPNSFRNITIPKFTMNKLILKREKQAAGIKLVFDDDGEYIYPSAASRYFVRECKKLGLTKIRFHEMRHTHATHLLRKYSVKVVAERLGDTPLTVLTTYAHVLPSMQDEVAEGIDTLF